MTPGDVFEQARARGFPAVRLGGVIVTEALLNGWPPKSDATFGYAPGLSLDVNGPRAWDRLCREAPAPIVTAALHTMLGTQASAWAAEAWRPEQAPAATHTPTPRGASDPPISHDEPVSGQPISAHALDSRETWTDFDAALSANITDSTARLLIDGPPAEPLARQVWIVQTCFRMAAEDGLRLPDDVAVHWRDRQGEPIAAGAVARDEAGAIAVYLAVDVDPTDLVRTTWHELRHVHDLAGDEDPTHDALERAAMAYSVRMMGRPRWW